MSDAFTTYSEAVATFKAARQRIVIMAASFNLAAAFLKDWDRLWPTGVDYPELQNENGRSRNTFSFKDWPTGQDVVDAVAASRTADSAMRIAFAALTAAQAGAAIPPDQIATSA